MEQHLITGRNLKKKVESKLEKLQRETKETVDEWCRQGRKLIDNGEYLKSIEYFDKALEIYPQYHEPIFNKSKAYYYAGMFIVKLWSGLTNQNIILKEQLTIMLSLNGLEIP